jgi:hypothetical protein
MNRLTMFAVVLAMLFCGCRRARTPDFIAGTNSVVWADKTLGTVVCGDGKTRPVRLGFRDDGCVLWRIDQ